MLDPVMIDSRGAKIETWLPHMQSEEFLREMIASGTRTEECWAELKSRNLRVQAGRDVIARMKSCNGHERVYEDGSGYICRHCGMDMDED